MKARILTTSTRGFYGQMPSGFSLYRRALRTRLGFETTTEVFESLTDLSRRMLDCSDDIVLVAPHLRESPSELAAVLRGVREVNPRPLILLDGHDQTSSPHFPVRPHVDRYVKGKMLSDRSSYQRDYLGGDIFSDYYSRT